MRLIARLLAYVALVLNPTAGFCQSGPPSVGPPSPPPSLSLALKALSAQSLPQDTLILTVGAENVPAQRQAQPQPVPNTNVDAYGNVIPPPPDPTTINGILAIYNRSWQTFGKIAAIAPTTMTLLNVDPSVLSQVDPIGLAPADAMKILLGSFNQAQWQELASGGVSIDGLDDTQSALFRAAVHTPLKVVPSTASWRPGFGQPGFDYQQYKQSYDSQEQTITSDMLAGARLEAHLATMYLLPVPDVSYQEWMDESGSSGIPGVYQISNDNAQDPNDNSLSSLVRANVPNVLKQGSLNWNIRPLGAVVPLDGVKTVDDLVNRIARATGLELYCDPNYASRSVLVLDTTGRPQRARDLMEGLCVCVSGAWRQVGPAYVLTDDIAGVAARRELLKDATGAWSNKLRKLTDTANDGMVDKDWIKTLQFLPGDPNALTPEQMQSLETKATGPQNGNDWLDLNYTQIPASAQTALKDQMDQFKGDNDFSKVSGALGPDYKMNAQLQVRVFLNVPSIGLVALDNGNYFTDVSLRKHGDRSFDPPPPAPGKDNKPAVLNGSVGVLCAPKDADEARAIVDKMAGAGLRLLYCDVFTNGKAYIANPAIPLSSPQAADVLPAAIEEGKAKGVKVVAMIDTFAWGQGDPKARLDPLPPGFSEDETITLQPASDALRQKAAEQDGSQPGGQLLTQFQWVSPANPAVQGALAQLVTAIARTPGLAGLAFEDSDPPGYMTVPNFYDPQSVPLGYSPLPRLAFLRAHHADPIDIGDDDNNQSVWVGTGIGGSFVNLDIPSYDSFGGGAADLRPVWNKVRKQMDTDALARLYGAARTVNPALPLFLRGMAFNDSTITPWTSPVVPDNQTNPGGFSPNQMPPGTQLIFPWSMLRANVSRASGIIPAINKEFGGAKTPLVMIFDLVRNPSPEGPLRDLEVISENVHFAPPAKDKRVN